MSFNDAKCSICYEKNIMNKFKCRTCKYSLCSDCLMKISSDSFDNIDKKMKMKFKCPICRDVNIYTYDDFERNDIIIMANSHIHQYIDLENNELKKVKENVDILDKKNKNLNKKNKDLENEILMLKNKYNDLENKNKEQLTFYYNCIKNQNNNLKFLCEMSKTKTIKKCLLKPLYEEKI